MGVGVEWGWEGEGRRTLSSSIFTLFSLALGESVGDCNLGFGVNCSFFIKSSHCFAWGASLNEGRVSLAL